MEVRAARSATICLHSNQLKGLHEILINANSNCFFIEQFAEPKAPTVTRPLVTFRSTVTQTTISGNQRNKLIPSQSSDTKRSCVTRLKQWYRQCCTEFVDPKWRPLHVQNYDCGNNCREIHSTLFFDKHWCQCTPWNMHGFYQWSWLWVSNVGHGQETTLKKCLMLI